MCRFNKCNIDRFSFSARKATTKDIVKKNLLKYAGLGLVTMAVQAWTGCKDEDTSAPESAARRPNIVLVVGDDVGLGDLGCYGGPFRTAAIDALALTGLRFGVCYASPVCGPSRCEILTGRYPFRTRFITNDSRFSISPKRETMIPTVMKAAGYKTACVGKWGQLPSGPGDWGFDEYLSFPGSGRYWRIEQSWGTYYEVNGERKELLAGQYLPDLMHDFLADFVKRNTNNPFFIYYPMSHLHSPIVQTPDSGGNVRKLYKQNVEYMDKLIGELVAVLNTNGVRDNTLIIFTSDNGMAGELTVNGRVLPGGKRVLSEGGCRVPLIINWPGKTPPGLGQVNNDLTDISDLFPTIAEIGSADLPKKVTIDGHSLASQIQGLPSTPRQWVYAECDGLSFARDALYKLTNRGELYDLIDAPYQETLVPADTTNEVAIASRTFLQEVLDDHPAIPTVNNPAISPTNSVVTNIDYEVDSSQDSENAP